MPTLPDYGQARQAEGRSQARSFPEPPEKDPDEMPATGPLPAFPECARTAGPPNSGWPAASVLPPPGALRAAAGAPRGHVRAVLNPRALRHLSADVRTLSPAPRPPPL